MVPATEINSTFYAMRLLSHRLDVTQVEVTEGDEYPATEFSTEEQALGLEILHRISGAQTVPLNELAEEEVQTHLTILANTIEELANNELAQAGFDLTASEPSLTIADLVEVSVEETLAAVERRMILDALEGTGHHLAAAAKILGVDRSTLARRLRQYQLKPRDSETKNA